MTQTHDIEAVFHKVHDALDRRDVDGVLEHFAEDGVVVNYSEPDVVHRGRANIGALIRSFYEVLPDLRMELLDLVWGDDRLAAELRMRATPVGASAPIEAQVCYFYSFRDGKIVSEHFYADARRLAGSD